MKEGIKQPWVCRWRPDGILRLRLLVDEIQNEGHPIRREHDLPKFSADGKELTDQREMRQGIIKSTNQHLEDLRIRYPDEDVLAFVGNGNLLANYGFVALSHGVLYHLADEPVFKSPYTCIVSWKDGHVTVEDIWFARENGRVIVLRKMDDTIEDITDEVDFATSGQPLVRNGRAVPLEQIAEQWYDTRHLVQPLRLSINGTALFVPNAQLQQGLLRKALCQPVHIRLEAQVDEQTVLPLTVSGWLKMAKEKPSALASASNFLKGRGILKGQENPDDSSVLLLAAETMESLLDEALKGAGYRLVDDSRPLREGEARFVNGHLEIFLKKALYPHNIFLGWFDGSCGFVIFPGKSGREGTTIHYAQQFLTEELKVQDAILLDNGGDVRLWYRGQYLVPSSETREEIRSILALTVPRGENVLGKISVS
ncbi:MAG: hypothetical protein GDYSWBUE_002205 [Candidatus Fervidibacterota bacterium]